MSPSLVQSKSATGTTGTSVTVTLTSNTGAGNCLVVCVGATQATTNPTVSGITLGGSAGNFALAKAVNTNGTAVDCEVWADPNCAGGQTSVVVSFNAGSGSGLGYVVWVMEWSGIVTSSPVDKTNGQAPGASASWSSLSSGTLSQASELVIGAIAQSAGSNSTITGPGAPWTNLAQVNAGIDVGLMAGYQVVSATTAQTYNGTQSLSGAGYGAVIATFKASGGGPPPPIGLLMVFP